MGPKFVDEVNRLFDQLVRDPWQREPVSRGPVRRPPRVTEWEAEIPLRPGWHGDLSIATEGRRLNVTLRRRSAWMRSGRGVSSAGAGEELIQQSFLLPEGGEVESVEARFAEDALRIRVELHGA